MGTEIETLALYTKKITGMIQQGNVDLRRPHHFSIGEGLLRFIQHLRCLVVILQSNLKIDMHVQEVWGKVYYKHW